MPFIDTNSLSKTGNILKFMIEKIIPNKNRNKTPENLDMDFIKRVQPQGGIYPHDNFLSLGDGYMTCISVYAAPDTVSRHWLYPIFQIENVIPRINIIPLKTDVVKKTIGKTHREYQSRYFEANNNVLEMTDASWGMQQLEELLNEIKERGNVVFGVEIKLYVFGKTFLELEKNVEKIERHLSKKSFSDFNRNINEQVNDYVSIYKSPEDNQGTLYARSGLPVPADILAQSLPFYYVGLQDKWGYKLGETYTTSGQGVVYFNPNYIDNYYRTSYDMLLCGRKNSGKSTMLKVLIEWLVATGNRVCVIDVTGEFVNLARNLEGVVIKMDGSVDSEMLNPLEVLRMGENDTQNYLKHISKLELMYRIKSPNAKENEVNMFLNMVKKLYVQFGFMEDESVQQYENLTGRNSKEYPTFSDLLKMINGEIHNMEKKNKDVSVEHNIKLLCNVRDFVENIVNNYGALFDGHTSLTEVVNADIIVYDIHEVSKMGGSVFDMQLFNVLSMAYDSCMTTGLLMKKLHDEGKIKDEDIIHHLIVCDECQKYINYNKPFAVEYMHDVMSQDRKYFIGVALSTQNVSNIYEPDDTSVSSQIKALFELCQYKMIFNQSASALPIIEKAFQRILTPEQIERIPFLQKREMIFVVSPVETIQLVCREVSKSKLAYFGGGA